MLKHFFVCFLSCISLISHSQGNIDVLHYDFEIEVNDNNDSIQGKATILVLVNKQTDTIAFNLKSLDRRNRGMIVTGTNVIRSNSPVASASHAKDQLIFWFKNPINIGDTVKVGINYKGIPADGLVISKSKYRRRTFFADNWPNRGQNWIPCVDDPADKASVDFIVKAPEHYQVVSNGVLVEETNLTDNKKLTHWKEEVPIATKVMVIGIADFAVNLSSVVDNCIPVYSWVYPEDRNKGLYDFALTADMLSYFIKNVGPYGYKKLANVQSKTMFGGLENANTIFYNENYVTGTRHYEETFAHEVAHQWFGNMATEKSFAHLWLSEGFATYMTTLYMEHKYGPERARTMLIADRDTLIDFARTSNLPVVYETTDYMSLLNVNSYQKGGWVLHMLRRQLGDSIFWKGIRNYYSIYCGKNADTHDLQLVFEKVSGKNLSTFFKQWLYGPGIPKLDVQWNYLAKEKKVSLTVKQQQENVFSFPLEILLKGESGSGQPAGVKISKPEETFTIQVKEKIASVILDPNVSLLFEGNVSEK
jgi:aminopeptidase N